MGLRKTNCQEDLACRPHLPSASPTWVSDRSAIQFSVSPSHTHLQDETALWKRADYTEYIIHHPLGAEWWTLVSMSPQWSRSSSWGSTCTKLAACLLQTAQACLIPLQECFSRHKAKSLRWERFAKLSCSSNIIYYTADHVAPYAFLFPRIILLGAGWDALPNLGPAAGVWERWVVWRGHRAERRPSYCCHWNLWSRHSGKGVFWLKEHLCLHFR